MKKLTSVFHPKGHGAPEYPCMMQSSHKSIILFSRCGEGIVLSQGSGCYKLGEYRNDWVMSNFHTIEGSVTITA